MGNAVLRLVPQVYVRASQDPRWDIAERELDEFARGVDDPNEFPGEYGRHEMAVLESILWRLLSEFSNLLLGYTENPAEKMVVLLASSRIRREYWRAESHAGAWVDNSWVEAGPVAPTLKQMDEALSLLASDPSENNVAVAAGILEDPVWERAAQLLRFQRSSVTPTDTDDGPAG